MALTIDKPPKRPKRKIGCACGPNGLGKIGGPILELVPTTKTDAPATVTAAPSSSTSYTPAAPLYLVSSAPSSGGTATALPSDASSATGLTEAPGGYTPTPASSSTSSSSSGGPVTYGSNSGDDGTFITDSATSSSSSSTDTLPTPPLAKPEPASSSSSASSGVTTRRIAGGAAIGLGMLLGIAAIAAHRRKKKGKRSPLLPIVAGVSVVGGVGLLVLARDQDRQERPGSYT